MAWYASWEAPGDISLHRPRSFSASVRFCKTTNAPSIMAVHSHYTQAVVGRNSRVLAFHYILGIWHNTGQVSRPIIFPLLRVYLCCENMFTESLPCNRCLFGHHYSGFQASGHIQLKSYLMCFLCGPGHIKYPKHS
jgi:hypothetical protein